MRTPLLVLCVLLPLNGCSPASPPTGEASPPAQQPVGTATPQPAFEDRIWRVSESTAVASGTLYEFRSNGTLVITSPGSEPMVGSWSRAGDGLTMTEESITYQVDILALTADTFAIRSHNPGEPVDIRMVPATNK
jgi:hypothetical protein